MLSKNYPINNRAIHHCKSWLLSPLARECYSHVTRHQSVPLCRMNLDEDTVIALVSSNWTTQADKWKHRIPGEFKKQSAVSKKAKNETKTMRIQRPKNERINFISGNLTSRRFHKIKKKTIEFLTIEKNFPLHVGSTVSVSRQHLIHSLIVNSELRWPDKLGTSSLP